MTQITRQKNIWKNINFCSRRLIGQFAFLHISWFSANRKQFEIGRNQGSLMKKYLLKPKRFSFIIFGSTFTKCRWTKISVQQYENTVKCYSRSQIILPSRPGAKREPGCVLLVQFGREEEDNKSCLPSSPRIPPFVKLAKCKYVILVDIRLRPAKSWGAWKPHKNVMIAQWSLKNLHFSDVQLSARANSNTCHHT